MPRLELANRLEPRRLHRADQVTGRHRGLVLDVGPLEREVDRGAHTVEAIERTLDASRAGAQLIPRRSRSVVVTP